MDRSEEAGMPRDLCGYLPVGSGFRVRGVKSLEHSGKHSNSVMISLGRWILGKKTGKFLGYSENQRWCTDSTGRGPKRPLFNPEPL